jgi:hypothetical protein
MTDCVKVGSPHARLLLPLATEGAPLQLVGVVVGLAAVLAVHAAGEVYHGTPTPLRNHEGTMQRPCQGSPSGATDNRRVMSVFPQGLRALGFKSVRASVRPDLVLVRPAWPDSYPRHRPQADRRTVRLRVQLASVACVGLIDRGWSDRRADGRRVVDAVAQEPHDVARPLQGFHDALLVGRGQPGEQGHLAGRAVHQPRAATG